MLGIIIKNKCTFESHKKKICKKDGQKFVKISEYSLKKRDF